MSEKLTNTKYILIENASILFLFQWSQSLVAKFGKSKSLKPITYFKSLFIPIKYKEKKCYNILFHIKPCHHLLAQILNFLLKSLFLYLSSFNNKYTGKLQ